jgi:acyl carrier protein
MEHHPEIKKAVVVPFETKFSYRINAFVVDNEMSQETFNSLNLKAFLSGRLPHYMQPHEIKLIDSIPLTQSGKVDFMALNAQLQKEMESIEYVAPETVTEKILHKILTSLLPDARIDVVTNFFDLGVDSILSLKATYEIKKKTGIKISGPQIYEHDNIKKMAAYIDKIIASEDEAEGDYYRLNHQEDNTEIIFLIPPLDVSSLIYVFLKPYVPEYLTVVVFDAFDLDKTEYTTSMEKMASYYTERILKMGKGKNIHLCGWSFGATVTYAVATQIQQTGEKIHSLTLVDPGFNTSDYDDRVTKKDLVEIMNKLLIQGGINPEMEIDISDKMFEANRLVKHYEPGSYYGDILLIKPELVSDFERNYGKKYNGMENFVKGNIILGKRIPGNHMTMMKGSIPYLSVAIFDNVRKNCENLKEA